MGTKSNHVFVSGRISQGYNEKGESMRQFITEYVVRVLVADLPQEYHYYSQTQVVKILRTLKALKKPFVYEVHVHNLH